MQSFAQWRGTPDGFIAQYGKSFEDLTVRLFFNKEFAEYPTAFFLAFKGKTGERRKVTLHIDQLTPTQYVVDTYGVIEYLKNRHTDPPLVAQYNGHWLLLDGHHRVSAEVIRGAKTIAAEELYFKD